MRLLSSYAAPGQLAHSLTFSKDGNRVYVGNSKSQVMAFDSLSGQSVQIFQGHRNRVSAVADAPEESEIVSGDSSGRVIIWDIESGQRLVTLTDGDQGITSLDWSPDGRQIVAGKEHGTVQIWTLPRSQ